MSRVITRKIKIYKHYFSKDAHRYAIISFVLTLMTKIN